MPLLSPSTSWEYSGSQVSGRNTLTKLEFFDHQYLWKESVNNLEFLHGGSHQGKIASETTQIKNILKWKIN